MSQENVEVVRRGLELWNRGEVTAVVDDYAEDAEVVTDPRFPEGGTFRGRQELLRWFEGVREGWVHGGSIIVRGVTEVGDQVLVPSEWRGTGETSGIDAVVPVTMLFTVQDGQITRLQYFLDHDEALEAVELRE